MHCLKICCACLPPNCRKPLTKCLPDIRFLKLGPFQASQHATFHSFPFACVLSTNQPTKQLTNLAAFPSYIHTYVQHICLHHMLFSIYLLPSIVPGLNCRSVCMYVHICVAPVASRPSVCLSVCSSRELVL